MVFVKLRSLLWLSAWKSAVNNHYIDKNIKVLEMFFCEWNVMSLWLNSPISSICHLRHLYSNLISWVSSFIIKSLVCQHSTLPQGPCSALPLSPYPSHSLPSHTHARTHTRTHACTDTHTHTHTVWLKSAVQSLLVPLGLRKNRIVQGGQEMTNDFMKMSVHSFLSSILNFCPLNGIKKLFLPLWKELFKVAEFALFSRDIKQTWKLTFPQLSLFGKTRIDFLVPAGLCWFMLVNH